MNIIVTWPSWTLGQAAKTFTMRWPTNTAKEWMMKRKTQKPQGVAEGFNDSSKDYGTDEVTITFDGDIPSKEEIIQYCKKNYGFVPSSIDIEPPSDFRGMSNPGIIRVKQGVAEEQLEETSPEAIAKIDQITRK